MPLATDLSLCHNINMEIKEYNNFYLEEIIHLYESVGWINYLEKSDILERAYARSLCVLAAYDEDQLIGIIRAVGDGVTIVFIQDIIVLPEYQRRGIGTQLLQSVIEKYEHVYQMELLTDNTEKAKAFYRSAGFNSAEDLDCVTFLKM